MKQRRKKQKRTGMTRLGSRPGVSSQSVSCFFGHFRPKTPKGTGMTRLGSPGVSSRSVSDFFDQNRKKSPGPEKHPKWLLLQKEFNSRMRGAICLYFHETKKKKTETDRDDTPGEPPRRVIPVRFVFFWAFSAENPERDWDDTPGLPRRVIPVCFRFF